MSKYINFYHNVESFRSEWQQAAAGGFRTLLQLHISLGKTEQGVVIGKRNVQNAWSILLFEWSTMVLKTFSKELAIFNGKYHKYVIKVVTDRPCEL